MSKLNKINNILHSTFLDNSDVLIEIDTDRFGEKFEMKRKIIAKAGLNYSLYKYDSQDEIFPYFRPHGVSNLKKMCDYVFFIEEGNHLFVFLVELKKGNDSAKKQLDAGECFINYLLSTINRLGEQLEINDQNLHFRKIRISESKSKKALLKKELTIQENGVIEHQHPQIFLINEYLTY